MQRGKGGIRRASGGSGLSCDTLEGDALGAVVHDDDAACTESESGQCAAHGRVVAVGVDAQIVCKLRTVVNDRFQKSAPRSAAATRWMTP